MKTLKEEREDFFKEKGEEIMSMFLDLTTESAESVAEAWDGLRNSCYNGSITGTRYYHEILDAWDERRNRFVKQQEAT